MVRIKLGSKGASVSAGGLTVALDHAGGEASGTRFVSHAHSDHISDIRAGQRVICSDPTKIFCAIRGRFFNKVSFGWASLIPNGHILGSTAFYVPGEFLYTGDFNDRDRPFQDGFRPLQARVIVTEATFGVRKFTFGKEEETISEAVEKIAELLGRGKCVVITGYPLGKSQHLQMFFDQQLGGFRCYVWPSIETYNDIYRLFGKHIRKKEEITTESTPRLLEAGARVVYMPSYAKRLPLYEELRKRGAISFAFSGWSILDQYSQMAEVDHSYAISDHADFDGLVKCVEMTNPEKVYVTHGFTGEFAKALRERGIDAEPLSGVHNRISHFLD
ncbi:MAG TPA: MBL fold metallo-hydrolase RNA specificity domain-containing protein [Thermoproteota archaeon]|nr:MBL fold metallo-hydrolase RNA specificity domain-containing protein [Thermoproteota archaeon]